MPAKDLTTGYTGVRGGPAAFIRTSLQRRAVTKTPVLSFEMRQHGFAK